MLAEHPRCRSQFTTGLKSLLVGMCLLMLVAATPLPALARPSAMKLFPQETLLLVRTPNVQELFQRFKETATGRMVRDPQLAPLVERLYGSAGDLYTERVAEMLGVSWEELQNLPQGEVAFAIVARKDNTPAFVLLVDQGDAPSVARELLDSALDRLHERGGEFSTETIEDTEVTVVRAGTDQRRTIGLFEKENTIVVATDAGLIREVLRHWSGDGELASASGDTGDTPATDIGANDESVTDIGANDDESSQTEPPQYGGRTLAENDKFVAILRHCRRQHDPPPNLIIYADPVGLIREFGRNNMGLRVALATFPALGVDGLSGIGVTQAFATGQYDDLSHVHVLLQNPRAGVIQLIAFEPGDITPEPWVFRDLETYMTWNWNMRATFNTLTALVDRFQYQGATAKFLADKITEPLGIDVATEIVDNLAGRYSWLIGYDKPATMRGQKHLLAAELNDAAAAEQTLDKLITRFPERFEDRQFGGVNYHAIVIPWPERMSEDERPIEPLVAIMDGTLFVGTSCQLFERAVEAHDGTIDRLADSPGYRQLADQVRREAPSVTPAMWLYSDFEATLRQWYDLLSSDRAREFLEQRAETNPMFAALADALNAGELPPFDVLARYTAPAGGILYDTPTGYHLISFTLRNDAEPTE